jgi:phenol 2-monooxygenase
MFESFGFSELVLKEAYWVNETSFWKPDERHRDSIVRSGTVQDTEDGLSEFPHSQRTSGLPMATSPSSD